MASNENSRSQKKVADTTVTSTQHGSSSDFNVPPPNRFDNEFAKNAGENTLCHESSPSIPGVSQPCVDKSNAMTSTSSLSTCVETSEPETDEEDIEGMDIETLKKKCKQLEKETREIECYLQENKQKIQQVNELTKILGLSKPTGEPKKLSLQEQGKNE